MPHPCRDSAHVAGVSASDGGSTMDNRTKKEAVTIASAALAITAAGALVDTGSAAAPSAGRGGATALAAEGWPGGGGLTAREAVREARAAAREDVFFGNEQQVAVTGGTREFSGVGGQLFPVEEGDTTVLVVHLVD